VSHTGAARYLHRVWGLGLRSGSSKPTTPAHRGRVKESIPSSSGCTCRGLCAGAQPSSAKAKRGHERPTCKPHSTQWPLQTVGCAAPARRLASDCHVVNISGALAGGGPGTTAWLWVRARSRSIMCTCALCWYVHMQCIEVDNWSIEVGYSDCKQGGPGRQTDRQTGRQTEK
jgi:hypothetical protein